MKNTIITGVVLVVAVNLAMIWHVNRQMRGMQMLNGGTRVLGNETEAEYSYRKAVQALDGGDVALAKLYCMNAINHFPVKKLYYEKLVEISGKMGDATHDDLEQVKGVLELGLFQVASDDVLDMRNMLASVIEKLTHMDAIALSATKEDGRKVIAEALVNVREGDLCYESAIATNGAERIDLLQRRLAVLRDLDKDILSSNDVVWVDEQEVWTRASIEYYRLIGSINSYLTRAEQLLKEKPSRLGSVNVMVQTASQLLSQAFGLALTTFPVAVDDELQSFAKRIEAIEIKFNKIKSEPAAKEVRDLIARVNKIHVYEPYQKKIVEIKSCLAKIAQKMSAVFDADMRNELEAEAKTVTEKLGICRQAQYKAYQWWAIDQCVRGMDLYRSWKVVTSKKAEQIVNDYLMEIDSALLTPDVTRLYQDVLGKQFAELDKDRFVEVETNLAKWKKKSLSDF